MRVHLRGGLLCLLSVVLPTSSGLTVRAEEPISSREAKPAEKVPCEGGDRGDESSDEQGNEEGGIGRADACVHRDRPKTERRELKTGQQSGSWTAWIAARGRDRDFGRFASTIDGALIVLGGGASDPREGLWAVGPPQRGA